MYWTLGKLVALIPSIILILSPFIGKFRRRFLNYEPLEDTWYNELYQAIEDKEIEGMAEAGVFLLGLIGILIISFVLYWIVVLTYPVIILVIVVMWALKTLYSKNKSKIKNN